MFKFSIKSVLILTFWIGVTVTGITVINSLTREAPEVVELLTALFSLMAVCFGFYSLFTSIYGLQLDRPFWIGCTVTSWFLILLEPFAGSGLTSISEIAAQYLASPDLSLQMLFSHQSGIASIIRSAIVPLLGVAGGVLASAISGETTAAENVSDTSDVDPLS